MQSRDWSPLRDALRADGYVCIPGLLSPTEVGAIRDAIGADLGSVKPSPLSWGKIDPVATLTMPLARRTIEDPRIREAGGSSVPSRPGDVISARTNWDRDRAAGGPDVPAAVIDELRAAGLELAEL